MIELQRYERNQKPWTASALCHAIDKGLAKYDNATQRTLVWTKEQKSLLIHSMMENSFIPPLYASKKGKVLDFVDGKQRSTCIHEFINNKFPLVGIPEVYDEDGKAIDYNGFFFDDLPKEIQELITGYSLNVYTIDDLDEREFGKLFYKLNAGTPPRQIDKNLALMPSLSQIIEIAKHPIFEAALTTKAINNKIDKDIVVKSLIMLKQEEPCLDAKDVKIFTREVKLTDKDTARLNHIYDIILECANQIREFEVHKYNPIKNSIIARRILGRSHIITLVPFIDSHKNEDILFLRDFLWGFYAGETQASVISSYNEASTQGSGHKDNIRKREAALEKGWLKFLRESKK